MSEQTIAEVKAAYEAPIGTSLPIYGEASQLDRTKWVPCTSEEHDLSPELVPNLEGRFLMGGLRIRDVVGGRNSLTPEGHHPHGCQTGTLGPYAHGEINFDRGPGRQDQFSHRHSIPNDGAHDHGGDLRPPFHGVSYIRRSA